MKEVLLVALGGSKSRGLSTSESDNDYHRIYIENPLTDSDMAAVEFQGRIVHKSLRMLLNQITVRGDIYAAEALYLTDGIIREHPAWSLVRTHRDELLSKRFILSLDETIDRLMKVDKPEAIEKRGLLALWFARSFRTVLEQGLIDMNGAQYAAEFDILRGAKTHQAFLDAISVHREVIDQMMETTSLRESVSDDTIQSILLEVSQFLQVP